MLLRRNHKRVRRIVRVHGVHPHPIEVARKRFPQPPRMPQARIRRRKVILHYVPQPPHAAAPRQRMIPSPLRRRFPPVRLQIPLSDLDRRSDARPRRLAQQPQPAVIVLICAVRAVSVIHRVHRHARLALRRHIRRDCRPQHRYLSLYDCVHIRPNRIHKRRQYHPRAVVPRLVHIQQHMRMPRIQAALHRKPRLPLREHKPVPIVIVSGVLVIQERRHHALILRPQRAFIPPLDLNQPVRVHTGNQQQDCIVQNAIHFVRVRARKMMRQRQRHLRSPHLRGVYAAHHRHHRPALRYQPLRLRLIRDTARIRQPPLYPLMLVQVCDVARR